MDVTDMHLQCDKDEDGQLKKQKQTTSHRYIGVSSSQMLVALLNRKGGSSMKVNVWLDMCGNTALNWWRTAALTMKKANRHLHPRLFDPSVYCNGPARSLKRSYRSCLS